MFRKYVPIITNTKDTLNWHWWMNHSLVWTHRFFFNQLVIHKFSTAKDQTLCLQNHCKQYILLNVRYYFRYKLDLMPGYLRSREFRFICISAAHLAPSPFHHNHVLNLKLNWRVTEKLTCPSSCTGRLNIGTQRSSREAKGAPGRPASGRACLSRRSLRPLSSETTLKSAVVFPTT